MKRIGLIVIGHFKPAWGELSEEEQAAFAARVGRTARKVGILPVVGYKLTTQGSFIEVWEAEDKTIVEAFIGELDALGYKKYYDQVLMLGERAEEWIAPESERSSVSKPDAPAASTRRAIGSESAGGSTRRVTRSSGDRVTTRRKSRPKS